MWRTAASATRPTRCWKNAWPRSKAAAGHCRWPAAGRRCTWRCPRWQAPGRTSWPVRRFVRRVSHNLLAYTLARFGIETTFVKPLDIDGWRASIRPNTRCCSARRWATRPGRAGHPHGERHRHEHGLPLLVDSTFTTLADETLRPWRRPAVPLGHQVPVGARHPSAACWSTAASSTGRLRVDSPS